jgi:hypothetical protein
MVFGYNILAEHAQKKDYTRWLESLGIIALFGHQYFIVRCSLTYKSAGFLFFIYSSLLGEQ